MDMVKILQIYTSLKEDGALEPEDWKILVEMMCEIVTDIRPTIKNPWLKLGLAGVQKVLEELEDYLVEQINNEKQYE